MKKMMKLLTVVAAAAMGLTACQNSFEEVTNEDIKSSVVINFISDEARTSVDTSDKDTPLFSWSENEEFAVLEQTDALAEATSVEYSKVDEKAYIDATFNINPGKAEYKYVAVYPKAAFDSATSLNEATLTLPAEQNAAATSYDPNADLMVSMPVVTDAQPTEAQPLRFTRLAAIAKMTIKNLPEGEQVEKVIFTADGKTLAGSISANLEDPHAAFEDKEGSVNNGVSTVSVTTTSTDVYFTVLPETLVAGDTYSVVILTNEHLFVKQGSIAEGKSLVFQAGMVTLFSVNLENIEPSGKWVLVRDASTLEAGDVVTIAASDLNMVLSCYNAASYPYPSTNTNILKLGDYLYHPVTVASDSKKMVQPLVLSKRDANKVAFDFYNGVDYDGDTKSGYFTNTGTANQLKLQNYPSNNTLFYITIDGENGVASVVASDSENNHKLLKYYDDYTDRFGCVSEALYDAAKHHDVCIYKWEGKKLTVPTADAVISVPKQVVVEVEGVAEATTFDGVEFTYIGDWAIEVSSSAEWLKLNYADGVLKYTATANPGGVRTAKVTITATHEGDEAQPLEFEVLQKGAPTKVTVAEFLAVAKEENANPNVEYEVTGILTKKATSESYSTTIADANGNVATFKYIYMTDNETLFINNSDIEVGDVVTIVAAVSDDATGGSSDAHAICKGYYNFSATAENDLVGYEGGSVKLTLTKGGDLEPAGDISCSVVGSGAEVTHTTNAMEATLTFKANDGAPRQAIVTFTDTYASASVTVVQSADTAKGNTWELVTDASTLSAYDQVIVAAATYDVAMGKTISSGENRPAVAVTKLGNYYITPTADVLTLVLANGSSVGTFAFYDAVNEGFLVSSSTSTSTYKLNKQTYIDANTSYAISIADGIATIGNKEGTYSSCKFGYRAGSNNYFFSGASTSQEKVCLYRLVGVKGEIPVIPADVTVPVATKPVVITDDGVAEPTVIEEVEFNYVGDWKIAVSDNAEWLNVAYDAAKNALTYTAEKNSDSKRDAEVTITASLDGQESLTWTFNMLQKGAPEEVSIAEFITKPVDVNVTYKLTGRILTIPSSATDYFVLTDADENQAKVRYLKTESGDNVKGNVDVREGDVITVTTVVTNNKGQGGNSTYPSYYKGHYRLAVSASLAADYTGGSVAIEVATSHNGSIELPTTPVSGAMEACDYATFSYDGGDTATVSFTSENTTSEAREATVTFTYGLASASVTVQQGVNPANKIGYELVTDASTLAVGDEVIIVARNKDKALGVSSSTITSQSNFPAVDIAKTGTVIYDADKAGVQPFTLVSGNSAGKFGFQFTHKDADYYLYVYSTSGLRGRKVSDGLNDRTSYTITIDSTSGSATILESVNTRYVKFNGAASGGTTFINTSSTNAAKEAYDVCIYKKQVK